MKLTTKNNMYCLRISVTLKYLETCLRAETDFDKWVEGYAKTYTFKKPLFTVYTNSINPDYVKSDDQLSHTLESLIDEAIESLNIDNGVDDIPECILYGAIIHIEGIGDESKAMKLIRDKSSYVHQPADGVIIFSKLLRFIEYDYSFSTRKILNTRVSYHGVSKINTLNHQLYKTQLKYMGLKDKIVHKNNLAYKVDKIPSYSGLEWYPTFILKPLNAEKVDTLKDFIINKVEV